MSLDFSLYVTEPHDVFSTNITHNLTKMADAVGVYDILWRPEENGITKAQQLVQPLSTALHMLRKDPDKFRGFDSPNGWGTYDNFIEFLQGILEACLEHPLSEVRACR